MECSEFPTFQNCGGMYEHSVRTETVGQLVGYESILRHGFTYRLEQADESLKSTHILIEHGQYRSAVNRAYYAMFYGVLALLSG